MEQVVVANRHGGLWKGYLTEYIGRPSVLGNPYPMHDNPSMRPVVVALYREWLRKQYLAGGAVRDKLESLAERVRDGECMALVCYCAPKACHGDVIKEAIEGINRRHNARILEDGKGKQGL
jgi:hypothetical protein